MNEYIKKSDKTPNLEGRDLGPDGELLKDEVFHRVSMRTTATEEAVDAKAIEAALDDLREEQAESIGGRAYEELLKLYPDHPRKAAWTKRLEELKK